jgi:NCS1 family nucleobase:cation symporter-1
MCILTTATSFTGKGAVSQVTRTITVLAFTALSVAVALVGSADFLANFKNFVLVLLMVFTPWSAINLTDYYLVSKERVDVPALYDAKGRYGAWNFPALACYFIGILIQIPFLAQTMYTGPITHLLGGADISWLVGLLGTALIYYPWAKRHRRHPAAMVYPTSVSSRGKGQ